MLNIKMMNVLIKKRKKKIIIHPEIKLILNQKKKIKFKKMKKSVMKMEIIFVGLYKILIGGMQLYKLLMYYIHWEIFQDIDAIDLVVNMKAKVIKIQDLENLNAKNAQKIQIFV